MSGAVAGVVACPGYDPYDIPFNLGCYAVQSGDLEDAEACLRRAKALDEGLRLHALDEPDFASLW